MYKFKVAISFCIDSKLYKKVEMEIRNSNLTKFDENAIPIATIKEWKKFSNF